MTGEVVQDNRFDGFPRRAVLAGAATGAALLATGCDVDADGTAPAPAAPSPFPHQSGVTTAPPVHSVFVAFDVTAPDRDGLVALFEELASMTTERTEAEWTVSVGAALFDDRYGLADRRPAKLIAMPSFPGDVLDEGQCHGDLLVQLSADEAETLDGLAEELTALDGIRERWRVEGFRDEPARTASGRPTMRDAFGFTEGIGNPDPTDTALLDTLVWLSPTEDEPAWTSGGSYLVVQLIRLATAIWDAESAERQEMVFGRDKDTGAPLGMDDPEAEPDYGSDPEGERIALDSHIRRANPGTPATDPSRMLRRGYNYARDGEAGLVFVCYQRDPEQAFATVRDRLTGQLLDRYILTVGGGYFLTLPAGTDATPLGTVLLRK